MHKLTNTLNDTKKLLDKKLKEFKLSNTTLLALSKLYLLENPTLETINEGSAINFEASIQELIALDLIYAKKDENSNQTFYFLTDKFYLFVYENNQSIISDGLVKEDFKFKAFNSLKILIHYLFSQKINRRLILTLLLFSACSAAFLSLSIFAMYDLTNTIMHLASDHSQKIISRFIIDLCLMAAFYILQVTFTLLQDFSFVYVAHNTGFKIRKEMFAKIQILPFSYLDRQSAGNVMSLFSNDVDSLVFTIVQNAGFVITAIFQTLSMIITMILINYVLGLSTILLSLLMLSFIFIFIKKSQPYFLQQQYKLADINGDITEAMNVHKMISIFDYHNEMSQKFDKRNKSLAKSSFFAQLISGIIYPYNNFVTNFVVSIVSLFSALLLVFHNDFLISTSLVHVGSADSPATSIAISQIMIFIVAIRQFTTPISNFFFTMNSFQLAFAAINRINQLLKEENESSDLNKKNLKIKEGQIQFKDVTFRYNKNGKDIIKDLTLDLKPNTVNAIAGPTGSGKTTIISLLTRFYDINDGKILIDGADISNVTRESVRENISIVLQDSYLFSTTILENIRCVKPEASREDVIKAAKLSNAHEFIMRLPDGYDTKINNGIELISEGEKQLIAIARAFLSHAKIIILDEATSYVDTKTEKDIQEAMKKLMKGRTTIVIAHRLSTIKDADQIAIIKDGVLIEKGNHQSLMRQKGFYYQLNTSADSDMDIKN